MKKLILAILCGVTLLFGSIDLNKASKEELMNIKGIGAKKAELIMEYRKTHQIKSADELKGLKGFGKVLIENIKNEVKISKAKTKTTK
jgi:competence protein ComEA